MKKYFFFTTCIFLCWRLCANDFANPDIDALEEVLIPNSKVLRSENFVTGFPIYASDVKVEMVKTQNWQEYGWTYCQHLGKYIGGEINPSSPTFSLKS